MQWFNVYANTVRLLEKRGFVVPWDRKVGSVDDFRQRYPIHADPQTLYGAMSFLCEHPRQFHVIFAPPGPSNKTAKAQLDAILKPFEDLSVEEDHVDIPVALVVYHGKPTPAAAAIMAKSDLLEFLDAAELRIFVPDHVLVPEHTIVTDAEAAEYRRIYQADETQFAQISRHDPVCRALGTLGPDQMVRIVRPPCGHETVRNVMLQDQ